MWRDFLNETIEHYHFTLQLQDRVTNPTPHEGQRCSLSFLARYIPVQSDNTSWCFQFAPFLQSGQLNSINATLKAPCGLQHHRAMCFNEQVSVLFCWHANNDAQIHLGDAGRSNDPKVISDCKILGKKRYPNVLGGRKTCSTGFSLGPKDTHSAFLIRNTKCDHKLCLFPSKLHGVPLIMIC